MLECCRIVLYLVEWIWTVSIMGLFPNRLVSTVQLGSGESEKACLFSLQLGLSRCNYGVSCSIPHCSAATCRICDCGPISSSMCEYA